MHLAQITVNNTADEPMEKSGKSLQKLWWGVLMYQTMARGTVIQMNYYVKMNRVCESIWKNFS